MYSDDEAENREAQDRDFKRILVATSPLEAKHVDELDAVFRYFDTDGDGQVSTGQARLAFRAAAVVYSPVDLRQGAKLTRHEWLRLCAQYAKIDAAPMSARDKFRFMFRAMNVYRRASLKTEELHQYFKSTGLGLSVEQVRVLVEATNKYGIGEAMEEDEFVTFMEKREAAEQARRRQESKQRDPSVEGGGGSVDDIDNANAAGSDSTVDVADAFGMF